MVAASIANQKRGGDRKSKNQSLNLDDDKSLEAAAKIMNVSRATVAQAKKVLKEGGPGMIACAL